MKTEPNHTIYPLDKEKSFFRGMTKRELMAIEFTKATMIGVISASGDTAHGWSSDEFSKAGLMQADSLIKLLNNE